jgi:Zn-dependent peptidase ImmA (M78 family)/DNA-binding XRE family transcriptional regulator
MNKTNNNMFVLAREARGYTQTELSKELGLTQGTLSKIELGLNEPSKDNLSQISDKLNFPISFFYKDDLIFNANDIYYRKIHNIRKKSISKAEALMNIIKISVDKLLKNIEMPDPNYINWNIDIHGTPSSAALKLREYWNIPKGRIDNITQIIENNGIIIIEFDFEIDKMDGISMFTRHQTPIIFINKNIPGCRQRFTIAHELGHIILHLKKIIPQSRDVEKEAWEFAAEFLIPKREFLSNVYKFDLTSLGALKSYWKVSMSALIYRAKSLNLLSENQARYLWQQMSALGYKIKEPIEFNIPKETPQTLKLILDEYFNQLSISKTELANLLQISLDDFNKYIDPTKKEPKIININSKTFLI